MCSEEQETFNPFKNTSIFLISEQKAQPLLQLEIHKVYKQLKSIALGHESQFHSQLQSNHHDITEILLEVTLNTITLTKIYNYLALIFLLLRFNLLIRFLRH